MKSWHEPCRLRLISNGPRQSRLSSPSLRSHRCPKRQAPCKRKRPRLRLRLNSQRKVLLPLCRRIRQQSQTSPKSRQRCRQLRGRTHHRARRKPKRHRKSHPRCNKQSCNPCSKPRNNRRRQQGGQRRLFSPRLRLNQQLSILHRSPAWSPFLGHAPAASRLRWARPRMRGRLSRRMRGSLPNRWYGGRRRQRQPCKFRPWPKRMPHRRRCRASL